MNIAIVIHSRTGHTLSVAKRLEEKLRASGHTVHLEQLEVHNDNEAKPEAIVLRQSPTLEPYEAVIFGAPVRGMQLSPAMQAYLKTLPGLEQKRVAGFVTQFFPFPSMGGNHAIKMMRDILLDKGVDLKLTGVVNWSIAGRREKLIRHSIETLHTITQA